MLIQVLARRIINRLGVEQYNNYFVFSGRVAITLLAQRFKRKGKVLIPYYICNVVDKAFLNAGYEILKYRLDDKFEPDLDEVVACIEKERDLDIILFASLYGSGRWIDVLLNEETRLVQLIIQNGIQVIFDFAQDITLVSKIKNSLPSYVHVVLSFNNKSVPGLMGALLISNHKLDVRYRKMSPKKKIILLEKLIIDCLRCIPVRSIFKIKNCSTRIAVGFKFDYSFCSTFPYDFTNYQVSYIQMLLAYLGIIRLEKYLKKKINFVKKFEDKIVKTAYYKTATYVVFRELVNTDHSLKNPYAVNDAPEKSILPDLIVYENKGYHDCLIKDVLSLLVGGF